MAVIMNDKVSVRGPAYFIQGDTQTQIVCFSVARYRDGVDLAQLAWSVHIKNAAGQEDVAVPHEQPDVRTDKININWLVKGVATAAAGYMTFCLRGVGTDPEGEPLRWSSGDDTREVRAAQESMASGEQADKLGELDALIEYVAKELPAVVQAGTEAKRAAADAEAAAAATHEAIDRANRLAALPDIGNPGDQGKVLTVGRGEGDAPEWILSSLIDDAAVSAESTWSSKNTVERFLPEFSESGAAVECHPFPLCPLNVSTTFEPAQAGSGEPYPAGGGRNLLNPSEAMANGNFEHHGITGTWTDDGDVILNGTVTEGTWVSIGSFMTIAGEIYWASVGETNATIAIWNRVAGAFATNVRRGSKANFVAADSGMHVCFINSVVGTTFTNERVKLMVNEGNDVLPWEPSINIRPISGYDKLELTQADETENKNTYTVHLGDTVYGGTYDWGKGELVADMLKMDYPQFMRILSMREYVSKSNTVQFRAYANQQIKIEGKVVSNMFPSMKNNWNYDRLSCALSASSGIDFAVPKSILSEYGWTESSTSADDVTCVKAWLDAAVANGNVLEFAYQCDTPVTIRLAPLEIMPLDGTNVLISNPGNTTVSGKLDPIYLHEQNKAAAAKLADMETRLRALESAAVNNA